MESIRPFFFCVAQGCFLIDKKSPTNFRILWCAPRIPSSTFWCWKKVLKPRYNLFVVDVANWLSFDTGDDIPRTQPTDLYFWREINPPKQGPNFNQSKGHQRVPRYILLPSLRIVSEHTTTSLKIGEKRLHGCHEVSSRGPGTSRKNMGSPMFLLHF